MACAAAADLCRALRWEPGARFLTREAGWGLDICNDGHNSRLFRCHKAIRSWTPPKQTTMPDHDPALDTSSTKSPVFSVLTEPA